MTRVGFATRFGATLVDGGLIAAGLHLVLLVDAMLSQFRLFPFGMLTALLGGVGLILYGLLDVYVNGTPGKKLLKLAIAAEDGSPARDLMLLRRWAVKYSGMLFAILGASMIFLSEGLRMRWGRDTREVLEVVGFIDVCFGALLMLILLVMTFVTLFRPDLRPPHDVLSGTSVFRSCEVLALRGFEPLVETPGSTSTPGEPPLAHARNGDAAEP